MGRLAWHKQIVFRLRVWIRGDVVICPACWLEVLSDFYDSHYQWHIGQHHVPDTESRGAFK